jgi:hypothetical protein
MLYTDAGPEHLDGWPVNHYLVHREKHTLAKSAVASKTNGAPKESPHRQRELNQGRRI